MPTGPALIGLDAVSRRGAAQPFRVDLVLMQPARRKLVLAATVIATFMPAVESSIVPTAMPTIVAAFGEFRLFSWVFAAYLLSYAVTVPIYGRLADLYGRKPLFYAGTGLFLVGSTLCGFAQDMQSLIVFRAIQGLGAGGVQPIAYTIIGDIYSPAERARVQGLLSATFALAALIGPSLGAVLVELSLWRVIFWLNLPIGVIAITMVEICLKEPPRRYRHQIDYVGSVLLMAGGGLLMTALVQAHSLSRSVFVCCIALGTSLLIVLIWHERRIDEPVLPSYLWRNRILALSCLGSFSIGAIMIGVNAFIPTYVQGVMGRSVSAGGAALGAMSVSWALASVAAGRIMIHASYRMTAILGGVALIVGGVGFAMMDPSSDPAWAVICSLVIGVGMGFCSTTYFVAAQAATGAQTRGSATSSIMFMRVAGQSTAAALLGAVANWSLHSSSLKEGVIDRLMNPVVRHSLDNAELAALISAMHTAIERVFIILAILGIAVLGLGLALPARLGARDLIVDSSSPSR
jgi:EmrB/QacA subfamily drug resistance transporter